jgi:predicted CoA-substrate-specific enzyme activase
LTVSAARGLRLDLKEVAMNAKPAVVAGLDVGTECVKAIVLDENRTVLGRATAPTRGYFQERGQEALQSALDEAKVTRGELADLCITGFGRTCIAGGTLDASDALCHARGAYHHHPHAMTLVDIGGRDPQVIHVDDEGRLTDVFTVRRCAVGLGTFLMYAARHLDVHPTRLQELAAAVDEPALVGSYCSVFAGSEILERLREGATREQVALGCMHSIAERVVEIGGFDAPVKVSGGVVEFFPGVIKALNASAGVETEVLPEPIMIGALGAALKALQTATQSSALG